MAKCGLCGEVVSGPGAIMRHRWDKHHDLAEAQRASALEKAHLARTKGASAEGGGKNGHSPPGEKTPKVQTAPSAGAKPAQSLEDATIIAIAPRRFEMTSTLLWQARAAAIREWGWTPDISPEDFLDTYLFISFKQRGIILGAYQVIDSGGKDGHR